MGKIFDREHETPHAVTRLIGGLYETWPNDAVYAARLGVQALDFPHTLYCYRYDDETTDTLQYQVIESLENIPPEAVVEFFFHSPEMVEYLTQTQSMLNRSGYELVLLDLWMWDSGPKRIEDLEPHFRMDLGRLYG